MATVILAPGNGQAVASQELWPRKIYLVAGSANATATVYANGVKIYPLAATAGTMGAIYESSSDERLGAQALPGPVTADVVGTGAQLVIEF